VFCVNKVGVELNSASESLLRYVSGIQPDVAANIVRKRAQLGGFASRDQLFEVDGIGPKTFEQCAGFLRIPGASNPLDATGIHPETYPVVEQIASTLGLSVAELLAGPGILHGLDLTQFQADSIGELTLGDILGELARPARDPRTEFQVPKFLEGVDSVQDVEEGMESEGVVTNVTDFGAFVDIGVHQDGLVHLSELAHRFVQDPRQVVKVGEIVKVKVIKVDKDLPRISLSIKALQPPPEPRPHRGRGRRHHGTGGEAPPRKDGPPAKKRAHPSQQRGRASGSRPTQQERPQRKDQSRMGRRDKKRERGLKHAMRAGGAQSRSSGTGRSRTGEQRGPLNTQLADQLAALKEKLGS
jgi:uncharacterized protein